ncbi:MAG: hypothetical protein ACYDBX_02250 [Patescibacteria group bacterium]
MNKVSISDSNGFSFHYDYGSNLGDLGAGGGEVAIASKQSNIIIDNNNFSENYFNNTSFSSTQNINCANPFGPGWKPSNACITQFDEIYLSPTNTSSKLKLTINGQTYHTSGLPSILKISQGTNQYTISFNFPSMVSLNYNGKYLTTLNLILKSIKF